MINPENEYKWLRLKSRHCEQHILSEYGKYLLIPTESECLLSFEETKNMVSSEFDTIPAPWFVSTVLFKDIWKIKEFIIRYVEFKEEPYYLSSIDGECSLRKYRIPNLAVLNLDFPFNTGDGLLFLSSYNKKEQIVLNWYELNNTFYMDLELSNSNRKKWPLYYRKGHIG